MYIPSLEEISRIVNITQSYPHFRQWYLNKVIPGIQTGERKILTEFKHNQLAGFAIIKNDGDEKKLCTLAVSTQFTHHGLGVKLFKRGMDELQTERPLLSVSDGKIDLFLPIFKYFGYEFSNSYSNLYLPSTVEYSYNGELK